MNNISKEIRELIIEVFAENDYLSNDNMAFVFLDAIRVTAIDEMKSDFKHAVRESLTDKLRSYPIQNHIHSNRQLPESYVGKLTDKVLELLSLKILNANNSVYDNGMGEFLYEGYPFIESGQLVSEDMFKKESIGKKYVISGRVVFKRVQKVKEHKDFLYLTVDDYNNGPRLNLLVPTELYKKHKEELSSIEGRSIGAYGEVRYNEYLKMNLLRVFELEIPNGYLIERKPV